MESTTNPAAYDEIAQSYHETIDPDGTGLRDQTFEQLVGEVAGQRVLSVACGQGRDARLLADLGADVVGIDISTGMLAYARELEAAQPRGIQYVEGSAHDLAPFDDTAFDGVACHMALIDIPDLRAAIGSVARVLKPNGWFVFSIVHPCFRPHLDAIHGYLVEGPYDKDTAVDWLPPHAYHRMLSTYVNLLAEAGISIVRMVEPPETPEALRDVPGLLYFRCHKG